MTYVPNLSANQSTKQQIIDVLSNEFPLSAKEIYSRLSRTSPKSLSYQAVHKTLKELLDENTIEKNSNSYKLSINWLENLKNFSESTSKLYHEKNSINYKKLFEEKDSFTIDFQGITPLCQLFVPFFSQPNPKNKPIVGQWRHSWSIIGAPVWAIEIMQEIVKKYKLFAIINSSSPVDKMIGNWWTNSGSKLAYGIPTAPLTDTLVFGDWVFQIHWQKKVMDEWDKMWKQVKKFEDFDLAWEIWSNTTDYYTIKTHTRKDPVLAEQLRKETIEKLQEAQQTPKSQNTTKAKQPRHLQETSA